MGCTIYGEDDNQCELKELKEENDEVKKSEKNYNFLIFKNLK